MRGFYILALLAFGTDQLTKLQARHLLQEESWVELLQGRIWATLAFNPHGAMSMGSGIPAEVLRPALTAVTVLSLALMLFLAYKREFRQSSAARTGLALMFGGGVGNLWDQLFDARGVTDFLSVGNGYPQYAIFNLADVWIAFGAVIGLVGVTGVFVQLYSQERQARRQLNGMRRTHPGLPGFERYKASAAPRS